MLDSTTTPEVQPRPKTDDTAGTAGLPDDRTRRLAHEIVARFVRDPSAFAEAAGAEDSSVFMRNYLQGLDRRLSTVVGAPKGAKARLATMGAPVIEAPADWRSPLPEGAETERIDQAPRMGVVAVVAAAAAVVAAATAVVTAMTALGLIRHKPL